MTDLPRDETVRKFWIICKDYGCEGLSEPFVVFDDETKAREARALLDMFDTGSVTLIEASDLPAALSGRSLHEKVRTE